MMSAFALSGCSFFASFDDFREAPDGSTDGSSTEPTLPCVDGTLEEGVPRNVDTMDGPDLVASTCGGAGAPDRRYEFTAPASAYYRVTTDGSGFDTVLSLYAPSCEEDAVEIACSDNHEVLPTSEIVIPLDANEKVVVVVDGNAGQGEAQVLAERVSCPETPLALATPIHHTTVSRPDDHASACGSGTAGDHAYRFVPPADGFYSLRAVREADDTRVALSVEVGPVCGGALLQCNAGEDGRSEVVRNLRAGEPVTVWVDALGSSGAGAYSLVAEALPSITCGESGAIENFQTIDTSIATTDAHRFSTSCASTSVWWYAAEDDPTDVKNFPDRTFTVDAPIEGTGCMASCTISIEARFPFAAAVLDGSDCSGAELACFGAPTMSEPAPGEPVWRQSITIDGVPEGAPRERILLIDRVQRDYQGGAVINYPDGDDLSVSMGCLGSC